jgi:hypothetical protein
VVLAFENADVKWQRGWDRGVLGGWIFLTPIDPSARMSEDARAFQDQVDAKRRQRQLVIEDRQRLVLHGFCLTDSDWWCRYHTSTRLAIVRSVRNSLKLTS